MKLVLYDNRAWGGYTTAKAQFRKTQGESFVSSVNERLGPDNGIDMGRANRQTANHINIERKTKDKAQETKEKHGQLTRKERKEND